MGKRRRERRASGHGTRTPVDPTLEHFEILIGDRSEKDSLTLVARAMVTRSGPHTIEFFPDNLPTADPKEDCRSH